MKLRSIFFVSTLLLIVLQAGSLNAQVKGNETGTYSFDFRGEELHKVLDVVAREAGIDMVYDPELVEGISIYKRIEKQSVPALLGEVLSGTSLDFLILSTGKYQRLKLVDQFTEWKETQFRK